MEESMRKKFILISIIISLFLLPVLANADTTMNSKAIALNKLTILQGDGVNFNLNGQLKRSEAVAFIVRIMGKESFVKANAAKYSKTTFTDIKPTDWFASYVGYGQENKILSGFPDGGFHPNDSISEKAFLRLVLGALGYIDQQDYVWDTIYESAFNLGLVSDVKYKTQVTDNSKYLRSDVVNVLYGSLTNSVKGLKKTIIDLLIESNVISRTTAVQLGFAKEIVLAKIDSVQAANDVTLNVKLSKPVQKLDDKNITIYETANKSNQLKASVTSQVYGDLIVNTSKQIPEKGYTIEISNKVEGNDSPVVASSTFVGYKTLEVKSNYFKISKVVPVSKNVINVYFTQPISSSAALPIYYEILKNDTSFVKGSLNNMTVKLLSEQNNVISLYLKNAAIVDDVPYSLKLNGDIISSYGVQLNDGLGDSITFAAKKQENETLKIDKLLVVDSKNIRIDFNKEVDLYTVQQTSNYQISSTTGLVTSVSRVMLPSDGKGKTVQLTTSSALDGSLNYQISISNVTDIFNLSTMAVTNYAFLGKPDTELKDLKLLLTNALDKTALQVYFDKRVDAVSAANNSLYMITGVTDPNFIAFPSKVYVNPTDSTLVKLYLPTGKELINTSSYKLKVLKQMPDEQGNVSSSDTTYTFIGSNEANVKPLITEAITIGKDTVKIKASKELLLSGTNLLLNNYSLELKEGKNTFITKTPSSIIAYDETTFILHFDDLDVTKNYTFKFNSLTDYSGLNTRTFADGSTSVLLKSGENTP
jgi:hypothetical protein